MLNILKGLSERFQNKGCKILEAYLHAVGTESISTCGNFLDFLQFNGLNGLVAFASVGLWERVNVGGICELFEDSGFLFYFWKNNGASQNFPMRSKHTEIVLSKRWHVSVLRTTRFNKLLLQKKKVQTTKFKQLSDSFESSTFSHSSESVQAVLVQAPGQKPRKGYQQEQSKEQVGKDTVQLKLVVSWKSNTELWTSKSHVHYFHSGNTNT